MVCKYCNGTKWLLYIQDAPSPPYKVGSKLEFAKRCVCVEQQRPAENYKRSETEI